MTFAQRKLFVLASWAAGVAIVGLIFAIEKPDLWLLIVILAIIPVVIANRLWDVPEPTLAELIAKGRARP
jgi:hypothetical protein